MKRRKVITALNIIQFYKYLVGKCANIEVLEHDLEYQEELFDTLGKRQDVEVLVLLDKLPGVLTKYELIEEVLKLQYDMKLIVVLSEPEDMEFVRFLRKKDIKDYFDGEGLVDEIIQAILFKERADDEIEEDAATVESKEESTEQKEEINPNKIYIQKEVVTIASPGGGGVGKSTFAVNLGVMAAKKYRQSKIAIVDFNIEKPDVCRLLNIDSSKGLEEVLQLIKMDEFSSKNVLKCMELAYANTPNLYIFPGLKRLYEASSITMYHYKEILIMLKKEFDLVIVDTGPFVNEATHAAFDKSTKIIFMVRDTEASIDSLKKKFEFYKEDLGIPLENKSDILMNMTVGYEPLNAEAIQKIFNKEPIANLKLNTEIVHLSEKYKPYVLDNSSRTRRERKQTDIALEKIYTYVEKKHFQGVASFFKRRLTS